MSSQDLIKKITDAEFPLDLVEKCLFEKLRKRNHIQVNSKQLKSSREMLISENFALCQGVSFIDINFQIGALAHNHPDNDPYYTLTGAWTGGELCLEDPKKIFGNMNQILAVHVYSSAGCQWPEVCIKEALRKAGIEKVVHIPIKSSKPNKIYWRHMVHDVKNGSVYVFPTDFDYGIKYSLTK